GIRDFHVTGVQTCALPICDAVRIAARVADIDAVRAGNRALDEARPPGPVRRAATVGEDVELQRCGRVGPEAGKGCDTAHAITSLWAVVWRRNSSASAGMIVRVTVWAISSASASVSALTVILTAFGAMWTPPPDDVPDAATPYPL